MIFIKVFEDDKITVYQNKDKRYRAYIKETKKVVSYPRLLMEEKLGRPLAENEQVHHENENFEDNSPNNLKIELLGDHQRIHSQKYFDKIEICPFCRKEFLWTARMQRDYARNSSRNNLGIIPGPFCSKRCSGSFSRQEQLRRDTYLNASKFGETFPNGNAEPSL